MKTGTVHGTALARLLALVAMLAVGGSVNAMVVLDQEHFVQDPNAEGVTSRDSFGRAQTFTVGLAGVLDHIEVQLVDSAASARIIATANGTPIGGSRGSVVLASSSSVSHSGRIFRFDMSTSALALSVGDVLAIELLGAPPPGPEAGNWLGRASDGSSYAGGSDFYFNAGIGVSNWTKLPGNDWNFRTFVNVSAVPEPGTFALLGLGLVGLAQLQRREVRRPTGGRRPPSCVQPPGMSHRHGIRSR